jgi:hypothetical protein
MLIGDIVLNKFGGVPENRILVYVGNDKFVYYCNGWKIGKWDRKSKFHDGTPNLEVIGHSEFMEVLKKDIKTFQRKVEDKEC